MHFSSIPQLAPNYRRVRQVALPNGNLANVKVRHETATVETTGAESRLAQAFVHSTK